MNLKKRIAVTLTFLLVFNFLGNINVFAENLSTNLKVNAIELDTDSVVDINEKEYASNLNSKIAMNLGTSFEAIGVKDNTKKLSNQYEAKNRFKYVKDGVSYTTSAFDFHIFSKEAILNGHTNGNIATKSLFANGSAFGTNQSTELKLKEDNYYMNSADRISNINSDGNIIIGPNVPIEFVDNNNSLIIGTNGSKLTTEKSSSVYQETNKSSNYIDIDDEFENLKTISSLLSDNKTSSGVTLSKANGENQTITVDGSLENINNYYLNIKASEISDGNNKRVLSIKIPLGKTLIINVDMASVNINYLKSLVTKINEYSNSEEVVRYENNVLWNLYDSSAVAKLFTTGTEYAQIGTSDYFMGTILSPNANIQYGAVNGSIIANKTLQNSQESHKWTFTGHTKENISSTTEVTIEASKTITGKDLEAGMFSFELLDESNNVLQTVKNDVDGKIQFGTITYNNVGTYKYKLKEVKGSLEGITYDERVFDVTVNVTKDENGKLVATAVYPEGKVVFENKIIQGSIEIKKVDENGNLLKGAEFTLYDKDGKEISKSISDENGIASFYAVDYGTYLLKETKAPDGYKKDDTVVKLVVESSKTQTFTFKNYKIKSDDNKENTSNVDKQNTNGKNNGDIDNKNISDPGKNLPSTGDVFDSRLILIFGLLLVLAGSGFMIKRKVKINK